MTNLGGHDLPSLLDAFEQAREHDRPVCFIAYTIKGFGLPLAGHKDNHAGLLTPTQMEALRGRNERAAGPRMGPVRRHRAPPRPSSSASWPRCRSSQKGTRRYAAPQVPVPEQLAVPGRSRRCRRRPASA